MKTKEQELIEKQRELIASLKFCWMPVNVNHQPYIIKIESEISALEAEIAKEKDEPLSQRRTAEGVMPSAETIFTNAWNLGQKQFINWIDPYLKELEKYTEK